MAKLRACGGKRKKTLLRLQIVMEKLQKGFFLGKKMAARPDYHDETEDVVRDTNHVPDDVKEGHLAVVASDEDGYRKRFIVPLGFLSHPSFLILLEQAAEEYGFDHQGALMVTCHPSELEKILKDQNPSGGSGSNHVIVGWGCSKTLVKTC